MKFSKQEYWSGLLFPCPGDLPNPGIEPRSLMYLALAGWFFTTNTTWEAYISLKIAYTLLFLFKLSAELKMLQYSFLM